MRMNRHEGGTIATATPVRPWRVLTTAEVADELRVSAKRVRELVAEGTLRPLRLGPRANYRFRRDELERLIAGRQEQTP
jgi:excisionase family DNA binding protein